MRQKIILSLFALFIFLAAGTVTAVLYMSSNTTALKNIIKLHEVEQLRRSLIIKIQNVQSDLYTYDSEFETDLDYLVNEAINLDKTADKCTSCHHSPELAERIDNVRTLINDYEVALSYYLTASANSQRIFQLKSNAASIGKELIKLTGAMSHSASRNLADLSKDAMDKMDNVMKILLVTIAVTFLLGILVAINLARSVTKPVHELVNATRMIASGEFGSKIAYKDRTEFGELADHFNSMSVAIKESYEKIKKEMSERQHAEEALRLSEERLQTVFDQMQDVFYRTDEDDKIIWVSPSAKKMFLYDSVSKLIGRKFSTLCRDPKKKERIFEEMFNKGKVNNYEMEMYRSDKSILIASINSHFYLDEQGKVAGIEGAIRDITEQRRYEEEHRKVEKLESVGILAGGIAHDFNNILTSIIGNISLIKSTADSGAGLNDMLSDAEEACRRAKDLTHQLLTFAKGGSPVKKALYLRNQIKDALRFALRGTNVICEFDISDDLWPAEIDEGQINQVLYNLAINANQSMPEGGIIDISAENINVSRESNLPLKQGDYIKISVQDHGKGISEDIIQKVFDPYFTTKEQGSGLGLSSTYSIIKNHNGHIDVQSVVDDGATFTLYLPAIRESLPGKEWKNQETIKGFGNILLMDDEKSVRDTVSKMLIHMGYDVVTAHDGAETIDLYKESLGNGKPIDVVIMDLTIRGGMGGREAIEKLLGIDPEAKAIVSSGYSTDTVMANHERYGFCGVISKPYEIHKLSELLSEILNGKSSA